MEVKDTFAMRITELRNKLGLTQGEVAEQLGISRQSVTLYEKKTRIPDIEILRRFAEFFGVTSDYLLGLTPNATTDTELNAVCEYTGLSEKAVVNLRKIGTQINGAGYGETLSDFVEDEEFALLLTLMSEVRGLDDSAAEVVYIRNAQLPYNNNDIIKHLSTRYFESVLKRINVKYLTEYKTKEERAVQALNRFAFDKAIVSHNDGSISDAEFEKTISEYAKGNFGYLPERRTTNAKENKRQE